jgi:hypothetical protein
MKYNQINYKKIGAYLSLSIVLLASACKKQLDQAPISQITPENFFTEQSQLAAYAVARYPSILPSQTGTLAPLASTRIRITWRYRI